MRPALLRLLKRPSALSILDTLVATPIGIDHLESRHTRVTCESRCAGRLAAGEKENSFPDDKSQTIRPTQDVFKTFSSPIYDIEPSTESQERETTHPNRSDRKALEKSVIESVHLQPEKLAFESDIGHTSDIGTRLVDHSDHKNNFELWEELLRFRQRHWGDQGTLDIWKGLSTRVNDVWLPVRGERADFFWQSFVKLGLERELYLKDVMDYAINLAEHQGQCWPYLHERAVGGLLERHRAVDAIKWHKKLVSTGLAGPDDLVRVLLPAIHAASKPFVLNPLTPRSGKRQTSGSRLKKFRSLYRSSPGLKIYGSAISMLLQKGCGEDAISLHEFLIKHNDHPTSLKELQPLLEYVRKYGLREEFKRVRSYAERRFEDDFKYADLKNPDSSEAKPTNTKKDMREGRPFKDDIGARLFATRALNFDMVLGTLKMLGASAIGPRTLREMALRSRGSQDILEKIKIIRQSGMPIADTAFARLVQKLAGQNREILLSDLLQSDQHPDVLDDVSVQEPLLFSNYMARDSRQYKLSLAILAELFPESPGLLDVHFRKHIVAGEFNEASKVVDELALNGKTLNEDSVDFMAEHVLTPRRMHRRPPPGRRLSTNDEVMFVFEILQRVVPAGGYVSAAFWAEMLKRLGMGRYWNDLRECCIWLVRQYSPKLQSQSEKPWVIPQSRMGTARALDSRMVDLIFSPYMQSAIVAWGFMYLVRDKTDPKSVYVHPTTGHKHIPWTRGLILLRELEQDGLVLETHAIRDATRARLANLYGEYCHSSRPLNRLLRRNNPYSLQEVLAEIDSAWRESSLWNGLDISQPERLVNPYRSPRSRRRSAKVILSRKER